MFCKLWGLVTDARNLRIAFARVARNRGRRTAGVDGITVGKVDEAGVDDIRRTSCARSFDPAPTGRAPVRRVLIPKNGTPGKFRPLGIPTVKDRVVQAALKNILEPVFEADFFPVSYGFRPGKSVHGALEHLRVLLRPKGGEPEVRSDGSRTNGSSRETSRDASTTSTITRLMERVRRRVADPKVNRLIVAFLKAGVLSEGSFLRSDAGTPQGGILSPLLANIALSVIEERYERHVWPRRIAPDAARRCAAGTTGAREPGRHDRRLGRTDRLPHSVRG